MHPDDTTDGASTSDVALPDGRYRVLSELGAGGSGRVFHALDTVLDKDVAIKILHDSMNSNPQQVVRFQREAQITAQFKHAGIVSVLDFGLTQKGQPYLVMDYVTGKSLETLVEEQRGLQFSFAKALIREILEAVKYAHERGVLHRDLKPSNIILLESSTNATSVKLIDFGMARLTEGGLDLTKSGNVFGSPPYMSPEQARGSTIDVRSEIYALGCTIFEILTGSPPFQRDSILETLQAHCSDAPPHLRDRAWNTTFPDELESLIAKCLEKDPDSRFQSVSELLDRFDSLLAQQHPQGPTSETLELFETEPATIFDTTPVSKSEGKMKRMLMVILLVLVTVGALTAVIMKPPNTQPEVKLEPPPLDGVPLFETMREPGERTCVYTSELIPINDKDLKGLEGKRGFNKLKLQDKSLTGTGFKFIDNPELQELEISDNPLTPEGFKTVCNLKSLTALHIVRCDALGDDDMKELQGLPNLLYLDLGNKNLTRRGVAELVKHPKLRDVNFNHMTIPTRAIAEFENGKSERYQIGIDNCRFNLEDLKAFEKSKKIFSMAFANITLDRALFEALTRIPCDRVSMFSCNFAPQDLFLLRKQKRLKMIEMEGCPDVTKKDVDKLKAKFGNSVTVLFSPIKPRERKPRNTTPQFLKGLE